MKDSTTVPTDVRIYQWLIGLSVIVTWLTLPFGGFLLWGQIQKWQVQALAEARARQAAEKARQAAAERAARINRALQTARTCHENGQGDCAIESWLNAKSLGHESHEMYASLCWFAKESWRLSPTACLSYCTKALQPLEGAQKNPALLCAKKPIKKPKYVDQYLKKPWLHRRLANRYLVIVYGSRKPAQSHAQQFRLQQNNVSSFLVRTSDFANLKPGSYLVAIQAIKKAKKAWPELKRLRQSGYKRAYLQFVGKYQGTTPFMQIVQGNSLVLWQDLKFQNLTPYRVNKDDVVRILSQKRTKSFRSKKEFEARLASGGSIQVLPFQSLVPQGKNRFFYPQQSKILLLSAQQRRYLESIGWVYQVQTQQNQVGWIAQSWFRE